MLDNRPTVSGLPAIDPAVVRRVGADEDLVSVFTAAAEKVGLCVARISAGQVVDCVIDLLLNVAGAASTSASASTSSSAPSSSSTSTSEVGEDETDPDSARKLKVMIDPSLYCRDAIVAASTGRFDLLDPECGDETMFAAEVGVTGVHAAVAETGSVVCTSGADLRRGTSLIPPVHVAIVMADQIKPDLLDLFTELSSAGLPASVTLISGPSKTADIEGILVTGVHGPKTVHVIVVEK